MFEVETLLKKWNFVKNKLKKSLNIKETIPTTSYSSENVYQNMSMIDPDDDIEMNLYIVHMIDVFLKNNYNLEDEILVDMARSIEKHGHFLMNGNSIKLPKLLVSKIRGDNFSNTLPFDYVKFKKQIQILSEDLTITGHYKIDFSDKEVIDYGNKKYKEESFDIVEFKTLTRPIDLRPHSNARDIFSVPFNSPITPEEIQTVIYNTRQTNVAGIDELSSRHYFYFVPEDLCVLASLFNAFMAREYIPAEFKISELKFIKKKGTDGKHLDDYRFISIFNSDYKIFTKIMNNRMARYMDAAMDTYQAGWSQKNIIQDIYDNAGLLDLAIQWLPENGDILYMDFKSAYDNVPHELLFEVARLTEIPGFESVVRSLYSDAKLLYNRNEYILQNKGLRLGDPLSSSLFALTMNIFMKFMKHRHRKSGLTFKHNHHSSSTLNIMSYVDDFVLIARSRKELIQYEESVKQFCKITNFKVNQKKTSTLKKSIRSYGHFDYLNSRYTGTGIQHFNGSNMLKKLVNAISMLPFDVLINFDKERSNEVRTVTKSYIEKYLRKALFVAGIGSNPEEADLIINTITEDFPHHKKFYHFIVKVLDLPKKDMLTRLENDKIGTGYVAIMRALINHPDSSYIKKSGSMANILRSRYKDEFPTFFDTLR